MLLTQARADAPLGLQEVVLRCLRKKPADRYPTVAELAADLLPYAPKVGRLSVERITRVMSAAGLTQSFSFPSTVPPPPEPLVQSVSSSATVLAGVTQHAWGASQTASRSNTRRLVLVGAATVLAGGAAALVFGLGSPSPTAPAVLAVAPPSAQVTAVPVVEPKSTSTAPERTAPERSLDDSAVPGSTPSADPAPAAKVPSAPPAAKPKHHARVAPKPLEGAARVKEAPATPQVPAVDLYQDRE